jgi:hypothetical protein
LALSIIKNNLGPAPRSLIQPILDSKDLNKRQKSRRVLAKLRDTYQSRSHTAVAEIGHLLHRIKPANTFEDALIIIATIREAQRQLTTMKKAKTEDDLKHILFENLESSCFDTVIDKINDHKRWTFERAAEEVFERHRQNNARTHKLADHLKQEAQSVLTKRSRDNDSIGAIASPSTFINSANTTTNCYNCNNPGHQAKDCKSLFCGRCKATWTSVISAGRHICINCPQNKKQSNLKVQNQIHGLAADRGEEDGQVFTDDELISRDIAQWSASKEFYERQCYF